MQLARAHTNLGLIIARLADRREKTGSRRRSRRDRRACCLDLFGHNQALGASPQQPLDEQGRDSAGLVFPLFFFKGENELFQRTSF